MYLLRSCSGQRYRAGSKSKNASEKASSGIHSVLSLRFQRVDIDRQRKKAAVEPSESFDKRRLRKLEDAERAKQEKLKRKLNPENRTRGTKLATATWRAGIEL